ncbi:thioredoxin [Candidatus Bathyarchaeota archaeon]|nr:thioredoxin [Candidatus Bathyarchaeota archaeon]
MSEIEEIRAKKMKELIQRLSEKNIPKKNPSGIIELSDENFSAVIEQYPFIIIDFWAPWCTPCRMLAPIIEALARDYGGRVLFGKLNTDENINTALKFGINAIPTLLFFKDGKLIDRVTGALSRELLEARIKRYL